MRYIELVEHVPLWIPRNELLQEEGIIIYNKFDKHQNKICIDFPSPKTKGNWVLTPTDWVGHLCLSKKRNIIIRPKVKLENIFLMLEYAYKLQKSCFLFDGGLVKCDSFHRYFNGLVKFFSQQVLNRIKKGLYRTYCDCSEIIPYIRGRIQYSDSFMYPWKKKFRCKFQEQSYDNVDNQLVIWTIFCLLRSSICNDQIKIMLKKSYDVLNNSVTLLPRSGTECINRSYNHLNNDYKPIHALCRFFLENAGPSHEIGSHDMIPFLIKMSKLFELFVAEWLKLNMPKEYKVAYLERVETIDGAFKFYIDIVLYDADGSPICIIDTKYKSVISRNDLFQIVAYANMKKCKKAIIVSPGEKNLGFSTVVGDIKIKQFFLDIGSDIDEAGIKMVGTLMKYLHTS